MKTGTRPAFLGYMGNIVRSVYSILEGMAVTASYLFRRPTTIQYPYKMETPIDDLLPGACRGILEVDLDYCFACLLCMKACPIDCIAITIDKDQETKQRFISQFDIDVSKCMFCGLCVEECSTESIHHTKLFDGVSHHVENLVLRFVDTPVIPFKKPKDVDHFPVNKTGDITREKLRDFFEKPDFRISEPEKKAEYEQSHL